MILCYINLFHIVCQKSILANTFNAVQTKMWKLFLFKSDKREIESAEPAEH